MEAYAIISIQTASPALDFQCLVFLTDELKTQLLHTMLNFLFLYKFFIHSTIKQSNYAKATPNQGGFFDVAYMLLSLWACTAYAVIGRQMLPKQRPVPKLQPMQQARRQQVLLGRLCATSPKHKRS